MWLLEMNGRFFLFKLKSLRHHLVLQEEVPVLLELKNIYHRNVDEDQYKVLKKYRLISEKEWNEEETKHRLLEKHRADQNMEHLTLMELFVSQKVQ